MSNAVFTDQGCQFIVGLLSGNEAITPDYLAWGTGVAVSTQQDTQLVNESTLEGRALCARSLPAPDTAAWTANLVAAAPKSITEAAIFTDSPGGRMILKADFPAVPLATGAAIQFIFTLRVTQA